MHVSKLSDAYFHAKVNDKLLVSIEARPMGAVQSPTWRFHDAIAVLASAPAVHMDRLSRCSSVLFCVMNFEALQVY